MALFGKMFEKKNCAICGKELGMFGKTKLADGFLCRDCDNKLSPFFTGRRSSTIEDIRAQLAYREQNATELASFAPTTTIDGGDKKIYLDETNGKLVLSGSSNWRGDNPDIIALEQVTGCETEVRETKTEIKREDAEGNEVSYNPPRYDIDYDIYIKVFFSHPYFSEVSWKANRSRIERRNSNEFRDAEQRAESVRQALLGIHKTVRAAAAPKRAVTCPNCLAVTMPDANGCCEYCGGSLAEVLPTEAPQESSEQAYDTQQSTRRTYDSSQEDERDYGEGVMRTPSQTRRTQQAQRSTTTQQAQRNTTTQQTQRNQNSATTQRNNQNSTTTQRNNQGGTTTQRTLTAEERARIRRMGQ